MKNIELIQNMKIEEMASMICKIESLELDMYCKSDCEGNFESTNPDEMCPHPVECCIRWLQEESV